MFPNILNSGMKKMHAVRQFITNVASGLGIIPSKELSSLIKEEETVNDKFENLIEHRHHLVDFLNQYADKQDKNAKKDLREISELFTSMNDNMEKMVHRLHEEFITPLHDIQDALRNLKDPEKKFNQAKNNYDSLKEKLENKRNERGNKVRQLGKDAPEVQTINDSITELETKVKDAKKSVDEARKDYENAKNNVKQLKGEKVNDILGNLMDIYTDFAETNLDIWREDQDQAKSEASSQ